MRRTKIDFDDAAENAWMRGERLQKPSASASWLAAACGRWTTVSARSIPRPITGTGHHSVARGCPRYVSFASNGGHQADFALLRTCARKRLMQCSNN